MFFKGNPSYWLVLLIIAPWSSRYVDATWPSSTLSTVKILGLFGDTANTSTYNTLATHSRAMFQAAVVLAQQYNITVEGQLIGWQVERTGGVAIDALKQTCRAVIDSNIIGIIGPGLSREAQIIAPFANTIGIPVISPAATAPDLSNRQAYPSFYRTVPSDNAAALLIARLFVRFNWTSCVIIYQNDQFGSGGAKVMSEAFKDHSILIREMIVFDIATYRIQGDLQSILLNSPTRLVVVWLDCTNTRLLLEMALDDDLVGPQFTWILSCVIQFSSFNKTSYSKLIGLLTIEPAVGSVINAPINTTLLTAAYQIWQRYEPESFPGSDDVNYYALFTFDATWSLIQSLQLLCSNTNAFSSSCLSTLPSTFCFDHRFVHSSAFLDAITSTAFRGVSGEVKFAANTTDRVTGSYYSVRNIQPTLTDGIECVPVLVSTDAGEWKASTGANVIVWPGNSLDPPSDRAILSGVTLRIGVIESTPFTTINDAIDRTGGNASQLIGYVPDLIELLRKKMGFTPELLLAPSNQTYAGLIQAVATGVYDIVVADLTVTAQRRDTVAFSMPIFDNSLRLIVREKSIADLEVFAYLKPYKTSLWMFVLATTVYAAILIYLLERNENEQFQNKHLVPSLCMSMWYALGHTMGYGSDFAAVTAAGRLVTVGLYLMSLVLVATYTANLASDLTLSKTKNIISGIDDIKTGKVPFNRVGIRVGTAGEEYYLREISRGIRNFHPLKSRKELYNSLLDGTIDASLIDIGVAEYVTNNIYCNLTLVGADFEKSAFAIATPKQWLYGQDLDVNLLALRESGALDELRSKWFEVSNCPSSSETTDSIGIEVLSGLFITFGVISVALICLEKTRCDQAMSSRNVCRSSGVPDHLKCDRFQRYRAGGHERMNM